MEINDVKVTSNTAKEISVIERATFEKEEGAPKTISALLVRGVLAAQNKAHERYSFAKGNTKIEKQAEPLSIGLEFCSSRNNTGSGISFDLTSLELSSVKDCVCQGEDTAYANANSGNLWERNSAENCKVGFQNGSGGIFIGNKTFFCEASYNGVSNVLPYSDPQVTVTTNIFN